MTSTTLSACRRLAAETHYLAGLFPKTPRETFYEDPTLQRAVAFSVRIIQHNIMSLKKMDVSEDPPLAEWLEFDFRQDLSVCVSYKRAPHDIEKPLIWKYVENRFPLLHQHVLALLPLLPQGGAETAEETAAEDAADNEALALASHLPDPRRAEWGRLLLEYNKYSHQCLASIGQIRRHCNLHNIAATLPEAPGEDDLARLLEIHAPGAPGDAPPARPEFENLVHQALDDFRLKSQSMTRIERIVASESDMLRAFQVPEFSPIGAFVVALLYPNPLDVNQKKFIAQMGYTPHVPRAKHTGVEAVRRQILRRAIEEAAKAVMETPDETSHLYLWARKELEAGEKTPHHVIYGIGRRLSGMLWHFIRAHPFKDVRVQNAFALKLARFASRVGEEHIRGLGFESCPDFVTQTCARFYTAQPPSGRPESAPGDDMDMPVTEEDDDDGPEAEAPPPAEPAEDTAVKVLMKIKGKLRFVDPATLAVEKRKPGRPRGSTNKKGRTPSSRPRS
ncbi:MAG: hypothetical protein FWF96_02615 [Kiritimatiellaeota bacterium]|nr:hypothetical protein [Kiritimatiellota bacterium]